MKVNEKRLAKSWLLKKSNYFNNYCPLWYFENFTNEFFIINNPTDFPEIVKYRHCNLTGNPRYPHAVLIYYCDFVDIINKENER